MIYSVITPETVPVAVGQQLHDLATGLALSHAVLRSSVTQSDHWQLQGAFEGNGTVERFVPWDGFNGKNSIDGYLLGDQKAAKHTARRYLSGFRRFKPQQQLLIAHYVYVCLGLKLRTPSQFLFYYAVPENRSQHHLELALKLARNYNIRTYNLGNPSDQALVQAWLTKLHTSKRNLSA
ncbi:hypothetical protein [Vibrio sp.]|uniref:hypothetical protein n=1 Tax=Vibrio sp. TaxID=678 RepID=UPI003D10E0B7